MPTPSVLISPLPKQQFFIPGTAGTPAAGAKLFTYAAGTTTKQNTYTDSTGTVPNTNPIILDANGQCTYWFDQSLLYKLTLAPATDTDPPTNPYWTVDNLNGPNSPTLASVLASFAAPSGSTLVGFQQAGIGAITTETVGKKLLEIVSVLDFGARGDGTGATPQSTGVDISAAAWNTWTGSPFQTNVAGSPYGAGIGSPTFAPPNPTPFLNTDTWDKIGCQLALWSSAKHVHCPAGNYMINMGAFYPGIGTSFSGLVMMASQEKFITGDGTYYTNFYPSQNAAFFAANHVGVLLAYSLLTFYRMGGLPTHVERIGFFGPVGYAPSNMNLNGVICNGGNGFTWRDLWIGAVEYGLYAQGTTGDSFVEDCVFEFCMGAGLLADSGTDLYCHRVNVASSGVTTTRQYGINATGANISIVDCKFFDCGGGSVLAGGGVFNGNTVSVAGIAENVVFTGAVAASGNRFIGAASSNAMLRLGANASLTGNTFINGVGGVNPCVVLGNNTPASATNITMQGNIFVQNDGTVVASNYAILAPVIAGTVYGAATGSCYIDGNTFQGRAYTSLGNARFGTNMFNGVQGPQTAVMTNAVPSVEWGINQAQPNHLVTLANTATYDLAVGSGILIVNDNTDGYIGIFAVSGNATAIISDPSAKFSTAQGTASKINVYYNGGTGAYRVENQLGASKDLYIGGIKAGPST